LKRMGGPRKIYRYTWGINSKRKTLKGRKCEILARFKMNSILIRFLDNGQMEVVSRWAVRCADD